MSNQSVNRSSRRWLLACGGAVLVTGITRVWSPDRACAQALTVSKDRPNWRFCRKCQVMFYLGSEKGSCAAGGQHLPQGYNFYLPHDVPGSASAQNNWRQCRFCQGIFFNGYPQKGRCPATGRGHEGEKDSDYVLPHDVGGTAKAQNQWRFCNKCFVMFYDGYPGKGVCAAGNAHLAQGYNFVLPHDL
jgi:hypothetical protein